MEHFVNQLFREASENWKGTMTVSRNAGKGNPKMGEIGVSPGAIRFKMSTVREVMKRKNQVSILVKKRLLETMKKEESRLEEDFQMKKLEHDLKEVKKEIKKLVKEAKKGSGEVPVVKVRLLVKYPKKDESILLREKDVKAEKLSRLGIPGAASLEKAVQAVQSQIDGVRKQQTEMLAEVGKILKSLEEEA